MSAPAASDTDPGRYTFGDSDQASERLRSLAELYEQESRELLRQCPVRHPALAVDLGCGPGWSTRLLRDVLSPSRTVGLDSSPRYVAEAQRRHGPAIEFHVHDIADPRFPVGPPDVMLCRFLLTHLRPLPRVLSAWAAAAAPGGWLLIHETEALETEHPALSLYYEMLDRLQRHHGQQLRVGAALEAACAEGGWNVVESHRRILEKPARSMAELHVANLRTWRNDDYARSAFDPAAVDALEASLEAVAGNAGDGGVVRNVARQIVARRAETPRP